MTDKTKKNLIYFGIGLVLVLIIRYFNLNFLPAMTLPLIVSITAGYFIKK